MKQYKNIVCITVALLTASTLLACGDNTADPATETQTDTVTEAETADTGLKSNLPKVDYEGATINILTAAEQLRRYYTVENESGDVIDDAVFKRNQAISEDLNVNLNFMVFNGYTAGMSTVATALRGSVMDGTGEFDLYTASSAYISGIILDNLFYNLTGLRYLDFEQPWWLSDVNEQLTIDGQLYLGAGTLGMQYLDDARCIYFNKKMADNLDIGDIYADVNAGKWTHELFTEYCKLANADLNGDGKQDGNDRYGYSNAFKTMKDIVEHKIPKMLSLFESIIIHTGALSGYDMEMFSLSKVKRYYETGVKSSFGEQLVEFGYPIDAIRRIEKEHTALLYFNFEESLEYCKKNLQRLCVGLDSYEQKLLKKFISKS